jgi:hypothetical protein
VSYGWFGQRALVGVREHAAGPAGESAAWSAPLSRLVGAARTGYIKLQGREIQRGSTRTCARSSTFAF